MSRDLFVSAYSPRLGNGRALRTFTVICALAERRPLDIVYVAHGGPPDPRLTAHPGIALHEVVPSRGVRRIGLTAEMRARGWQWPLARSCSPELRDAALDLAAAPERGRIIAGDLAAIALLMGLARRRPVIYNAHNVESSYERNPYGLDRARWRPLRSLERTILATAEESWMVSHRDVELATALCPDARLRYVPNVVDVAAILPPPPWSGPPTALMVADFSYPPNRRSAEWLIEQVMPLVWDRSPQTRLRLTGRGLTLTDVDPRVEVTGFVEDIADAYAAASVVLVPLVEGAGTPLKFVEALAYGSSVVATPVAARGLDVAPGVHYRAGETAAEFAEAVVELIDDPDPALGVAARRLAEREYSVQTLARQLDDDLTVPGDAGGRPGPAQPSGVGR